MIFGGRQIILEEFNNFWNTKIQAGLFKLFSASLGFLNVLYQLSLCDLNYSVEPEQVQ